MRLDSRNKRIDNANENDDMLPWLIKDRGNMKKDWGDLKGACEDWKKAAELGDEDAAELLKEHCQ